MSCVIIALVLVTVNSSLTEICGVKLASVSVRNPITVWDIFRPYRLPSALHHRSNLVQDVSMGPFGRSTASLGSDRALCIFIKVLIRAYILWPFRL